MSEAYFLIARSVGVGGVNLAQNVRRLQSLLNRVPARLRGQAAPLRVDGHVGSGLIAAIQAFQLFTGCPVVNGRVDPGSETANRLAAFDQSPGSFPGDPPPPAPTPQRVDLGKLWPRDSGWTYNSLNSLSIGAWRFSAGGSMFKAGKTHKDTDRGTGPDPDDMIPGVVDHQFIYAAGSVGVGTGKSLLPVTCDLSTDVVQWPSTIFKTRKIPIGQPLRDTDLVGPSLVIAGSVNWLSGLPQMGGVGPGGRQGAVNLFGVRPDMESVLRGIVNQLLGVVPIVGPPASVLAQFANLCASSRALCFTWGSGVGVPGVGVSMNAQWVTRNGIL